MKAIVVGGGSAGILSALELASQGDQVTLVESSPKLGGLLGSVDLEDGGTFDYGSHLLTETGVEDLDALLFERVDKSEWNSFDYLAAGSFFQGQLSDQSPFVDARTLGEELYARGESELLAIDADGAEPSFANAGQECRGRYGETFTDHIFAPALDKFFGTPLDELEAGAHLLFGMGRLVCSEPERVRELKKNPVLDDKLSFHSYHEGKSNRLNYYPKRSGMKLWIDGLRRQLDEKNVQVLTGAKIRGLNRKGSRITGLDIDPLGPCPCDALVWTAPPAILLKLSDLPTPGKPGPPPCTSVQIFHLSVDRPPETEAFYVTCYDPGLAIFRVTLYNKMRLDQPQDRWSLTVEVLSPPGRDRNLSQESILGELVQMGIFPEETSVCFFHSDKISRGFPILSTRLTEKSKAQAQCVEENLENVLLAGRASARCFFLHDVLTSTYRELKEFRRTAV